MSRRTVVNYESEATTPKPLVVKMWAMATGVDSRWLETGKAPSPGDGDGASALPQLDSNQQPFD